MLKSKQEIKIFVLHMLASVGRELEFEDLNDMVLCDGLVGGLDFYECFAELKSSELLAETRVDGKLKFALTDQGRHVAATLAPELAPHLRTRAVKSALRYLDFKQRKVKLETTYSERYDGRYDFSCFIDEAGATLLQLQLLVDNKAQVERMNLVFRDRPEHIYKCLLALLNGEAGYLD